MAAALIGATGFGMFGACGGSTIKATSCDPGDVRLCQVDGCQGVQVCREDGKDFGACQCVTIGAGGSSVGGGVSVGGASGVSGAGGSNVGGAGPGGSGFGIGGANIGGIGGVGGAITDAGGIDACVLVRAEAKPAPLDIFILLDQSGSMTLTENRWTPLVDAIKTFVASPQMEGVGVGLNYFGLFPPGQPPVDPVDPGSCNANDYARPDVPIEVLPSVRMKIENSLNAHSTLGGGTPTHPALQGTLQYVTAHSLANPDRNAIIVLATDGEPQGCTGNDVASVAQVAAAGFAANPAITTYVVGVGPSLQALNQIAQAGGSNQAYLPGAGNGPQILEALRAIHRLAGGCEFSAPRLPGERPTDFAQVNLVYAPPNGAEELIYKVQRPADCDPQLGGWYFQYGAQSFPTTVVTCPATCNELLDRGGRIDFAFGCFSIPPPPP